MPSRSVMARLDEYGAEHLNAVELLGANRIGPLLLATAQFCFGGGQIPQAIIPVGSQAASNKAVSRLTARYRRSAS